MEKFFQKFDFSKKLIDRIFPRIRKNASKKIQKYESLALVFFVALPLPFTGAGLGVVIAYLFDLKFSNSIIMIFIGVIISSFLVTFVYLTGNYLFFNF